MSGNMHFKTSFLILGLIFLFLIPYSYAQGAEGAWKPGDLVDEAINGINMTNIREHVRVLSSYQSRMTGYPGYEMAADYVYNYLANQLGLNTWIWTYNVLVPIDHGSSLTVLSPEPKVMEAYALMPNGIQTCKTPPSGVSGRLIYVEDGDPEDFDGFDVEGSIVLMKFNSKGNWVNAMTFGAKAVIFTDMAWTIRGEMDYKIVMAPIKFPRLYISDEDAEYLLQILGPDCGRSTMVEVRVDVNMLWEKVAAKNIFAFINGTGVKEKPELVNQTVMLAAYYDAASGIPAIAPGAEEALGISSLLELARILKEHPPYRPVLIAAFSGQYFAMSGARAFAEDLFYQHWGKDQAKVAEGSLRTFGVYGDQIRMILVLDFSTESNKVVLANWGTHVGQWDPTEGRGSVFPERYLKYEFGTYYPINYTHTLPGGRSYRVFFSIGGLDRVWLPAMASHLSEVFNQAGVLSLTFYTAEAARLSWDTPVNRFEFVKFENLQPQVEYSFSMINLIVKDTRRRATTALTTEMTHSPERGAPRGYALLSGRVGRFNYTKSWYDYDWDRILGEDGQLLVYVRIVAKDLTLFRHYFIVEAERGNGTFLIPGLRPTGWAVTTAEYEVAAFVVNRTTGNIEWAPDFSFYGTKLWPFGPVFTLLSGEETGGQKPVHVSLFRAGAIVIHDTIDPRTLSSPLLVTMRPTVFRIYDIRTHAAPIHYSYYIASPLPPPMMAGAAMALGIGDPTLGYDALIFVPPATPVEILFLGAGTEVPLGILTNSGQGLTVEAGKYLDIPLTAFNYAEEFISVAGERVNSLKKEAAVAQTIPPAISDYEVAMNIYDAGKKALEERRYSEVYPNIYRSWFYARRAYDITKAVYVDVVHTTIFFFSLLIPFSILLESLLTHKEGIRKILYVSLFFAAGVLLLYVLHPGLRLASNALVAILGLIVTILTLPVLGIVLTRSWEIAKLIRRRMVGPHFIEVARTSEIASALTTGVENIRKMKLRTTLTLTTIVLIVFSLTSFTALTFSDVRQSFPLETREEPPYTGILVKGLEREGGSLSLTPTIYEYLMAFAGPEAVVAPRAWLLPPYLFFYVHNEAGDTSEARAIVGLAPQEALWDKILEFVITPSRPFESGDRFVAFISKDISDELNVTRIGETISVAGISLRVLGIVKTEDFWKIQDIDGRLFTPIDRTMPMGTNIPVSSYFIIIPYELAVRMGGIMPSVAVRYENATLAQEGAFQVSEQLSAYLTTYYSAHGKSYLATWRKGYKIFGLQFVIVPFIITAFILLNVMLGQVHERIRYVSIYSSLGLSPMHVAIMFLVEALVFAILGATLGYLLALGIGAAVAAFAPGAIFINYTSAYVILSAAASIGTVMASSLYPAFKASRFVTPSLERVWEVPTKPIGTEWSIPLPFTVTEEEVLGSLTYIGEYLVRYGTEAEKFMVEEKPKYVTRTTPKMLIREVDAAIRLRPYEQGIVERLSLVAVKPIKEEKYTFELKGTLETGPRYLWVTGHRTFADLIRKQFLLWRSLRTHERRAYIDLAKKVFETDEGDRT